MKIKRFFSKDMRSVIRMVREELGPDAVILSNNRVNGGVEIIAAVDYDESLLGQSGTNPNVAAAESTDLLIATNTTTFSEKTKVEVKAKPKPTNTTDRKAIPVQVKIPAPGQSPNESLSEINDLLEDRLELSTPAPSVGNQRNPFGESKRKLRKSESIDDKDDLDLEGFSEAFLEAAMEADPDLSQSAGSITLGAAPPSKSRPTDKREKPVSFYQNPNYQAQSLQRFYNLDGTVPEQKFTDTPGISNRPSKTGGVSGQEGNIWSQEPTLVSMRNEIMTLRGLLEQQLTGLAWGETERRNPGRAKLIRQLLELDLSANIAQRVADHVADQAGNGGDYQNAWQDALTYLTNHLPVIEEEQTTGGGIFALIGPTGVGKTTTVAKLASRFALRYGRTNIGLITVDNYRVGAHEHLKTYARIFDIPMRVATNQESLRDCVKAMADRQLILIDSAGMSHRDGRLANQFQLLQACAPTLKTLLVLPATHHRSTLDETVRGFSKIKLHGCILTKLDETTSLGGALSVALKHNLPVNYYCDGQKMPDALHLANAHDLVNRSVLIAHKSNQPLNNEAVELAFTGVPRDARL